MTAFIRVIGSGQLAKVDDSIQIEMSRHNWRAWATPKGDVYARAYVYGKRMFMHAYAAQLYGIQGQNIDHRNRNTLDNTSANLRGCTPSDNATNSHRGGFGASGIRGVVKCQGRWAAKFCRDGVRHYLGLFDTPEEAARVVAKARLEVCGEFIPAAEVAALKQRLQELERAA